MDPRKLQGWHADPFGLHEFRYFSVGNPTKLVRDGSIEAYDEPPTQESPPAGAAVAAGIPGGTEPAVAAVQPTATYRDPVPPGHGRAPNLGHPARRRRTGLVYGTVALVAVAAVIAFVAIWGRSPTAASHSGLTGASLAAFVTRSASETLAQQTADFTVQGTIDVGSTEVDLRGNGQENFAANTLAMNVSTTYSGSAIAVSEIVTSTDVYEQLSIGGQSMAQYFGGRHWFAIPLAASPAQNGPQDSAAGNLQMLEEQSVRVVPMGSQDIGGRNCSEYVVTPSTQAMLAAAQQEWAKMGLSSSEEAAAQQQLENVTPPTITVWFDPARQLTCQLDVYMQFSVGAPAGSGSAPSTESGQMLMTFTHYGVPVTITPPAPSDTVTF